MTESAAAHKALDLIAIGRSSIDLYGQQIGGRLEDAASFAKSAGGLPRQHLHRRRATRLRSALITRVCGEEMGSFIREQLVREGVVIDSYTMDKNKAPQSLDDLVQNGYLKVIPKHLFTHSRDTWVTASDDTYADLDQTEPGVNDVHSGSEEQGSDGNEFTW